MAYGTSGMEYYGSTVRATYKQAILECEAMNSQLIKLTDQATADVFVSLFTKTYIIDLNDFDNGNHSWMFI